MDFCAIFLHTVNSRQYLTHSSHFSPKHLISFVFHPFLSRFSLFTSFFQLLVLPWGIQYTNEYLYENLSHTVSPSISFSLSFAVSFSLPLFLSDSLCLYSLDLLAVYLFSSSLILSTVSFALSLSRYLLLSDSLFLFENMRIKRVRCFLPLFFFDCGERYI